MHIPKQHAVREILCSRIKLPTSRFFNGTNSDPQPASRPASGPFGSIRVSTHTQIVSVLTPIDFCHAWAIFGPLVDKNTGKGELVELPANDT